MVERRWLPACLVVAVVLLITVGPGVLGAPDASAEVLDVAGVARIDPASGWTVAADTTAASAHLELGSADLYVRADPGNATPAPLVATSYAEQVLYAELEQVSVDSSPEEGTVLGAPAVRFGYVGVSPAGVAVEGVVVAVSTPAGALVFDARAPQGELGAAIDGVGRMIDTAELA